VTPTAQERERTVWKFTFSSFVAATALL